MPIRVIKDILAVLEPILTERLLRELLPRVGVEGLPLHVFDILVDILLKLGLVVIGVIHGLLPLDFGFGYILLGIVLGIVEMMRHRLMLASSHFLSFI